MPLSNISEIVLILSGKGGVGKSSTTVQLALALTLQSHSIGILDIDLTGPNIPRLLGIEDAKITQGKAGWRPVTVYPAHDPPPTSTTTEGTREQPHKKPDPSSSTPRGALHAISLALLLPSRSSAVIWRGPKKTAMIRQFLADVDWPPLDYLLVDTPPGTSDEHIALLEELGKLTTPSDAVGTDGSKPRLKGALVVTTPQAVATADVRKELSFCVKTGTRVLGVLENMAGYVCPCCGEVSNVFSRGGGEVMARECGVEFWGSLPLDPGWGRVVDPESKQEGDSGSRSGKGLLERYERCALSGIFAGIARRLEGGTMDTG